MKGAPLFFFCGAWPLIPIALLNSDSLCDTLLSERKPLLFLPLVFSQKLFPHSPFTHSDYPTGHSRLPPLLVPCLSSGTLGPARQREYCTASSMCNALSQLWPMPFFNLLLPTNIFLHPSRSKTVHGRIFLLLSFSPRRRIPPPSRVFFRIVCSFNLVAFLPLPTLQDSCLFLSQGKTRCSGLTDPV